MTQDSIIVITIADILKWTLCKTNRDAVGSGSIGQVSSFLWSPRRCLTCLSTHCPLSLSVTGSFSYWVENLVGSIYVEIKNWIFTTTSRQNAIPLGEYGNILSELINLMKGNVQYYWLEVNKLFESVGGFNNNYYEKKLRTHYILVIKAISFITKYR